MLSNKLPNKTTVSKLSYLLLFCLPILIVFSGIAYSKKNTSVSFTESVITTPFKLTHPIMPIDILKNQGKELVTFSIDESAKRWLIVYVQNNKQAYTEHYRVPLPTNFYSFDISPSHKKSLQSLYFLSSHQLFVLNEQQITQKLAFKAVHKISSMPTGSNKQYLARDHFLTQLNTNEQASLFITDFNQVHILMPTDNGFKTSSLPIQPETSFTPEITRYYKNKIHFGDVNFDNLSDVMYVNNGQLVYFLQQANSTISPIAQYIQLNELVSGIDWWNKFDADGEKFDQSTLNYRKIEQFKDINNDNIIDMVVRFTQSEGVLNKTNDYEVYLGQNINNTLHFLAKPNSAITAEGTLTDIQFVDINNDKKDEILVAGFDIGVSQIIGALLSGSIDQDVHLFYMDEKGQFNKKSKVTKEVELNFSLSSGTSGDPVVKLLDVNGDKLQDLMLSEDDDTLKIYLGINSDRLFDRKPQKYETLIPAQGDMLVSDDLNNDGKDDILIKFGRTDDIELQKSFRILISTAI